MAEKKSNRSEHKTVAILSYFIIGIIWYFADKNVQNTKTKFHVKQAINLFIISIAIDVVLRIILPFSHAVFRLVALVLFILWVLGIVAALNEKNKEIPIIGSFAEQYLKF